MVTKSFRQTATIHASPHDVYEAYLDSKRHSEITGSTARITRRVGGKFSTFDGWATGTIVELRKDAEIVSTWRSDDFAERDEDSRVTIRLRRRRNGTQLNLVHSGVPDGQVAALKQGWIDFYWTPLRAHFEKRRGRATSANTDRRRT